MDPTKLTMSAPPTTGLFVLPNLTRWAESHISTILKAKTKEEFDNAFDYFLAKEAQVTVNGQEIPRDEYKLRLLELSDAATLVEGIEVKFGSAVEQESNGKLAGSVGIFCEEMINQKIRILGGAAQISVNFSMNLLIKEDPSVVKPHPDLRRYFDPRRAFVVNQVLTEARVPVTLPVPIDVPDLPPIETSSATGT